MKFAKYIPVLGSIVHGDKYITEQQEKIEHRVFKNVGLIPHFSYINKHFAATYGIFKVEMFLCSNNIVLGKPCYHPIHLKVINVTDESEISALKESGCVTIHGKFLSGFDVKEGDEFMDNEFEVIHEYIGYEESKVDFNESFKVTYNTYIKPLK